eukprot:CAMPEP_0184355708 /NCGR_PEP_ID=MMETSP1089-20130417/97917_1 /TAXON_ID=38269 ORGANISM="Gloeochaete wittrockiana, Strain SAG46.84" /NCGR_SAMPLE_ID=MMETSP1089 /ASSEMBLY_ACC=CAM_ASM_000445 /LENGTH=33 /DNA_ID= /DNA_START= /DNA_END= /DNA_ORIENTATION=
MADHDLLVLAVRADDGLVDGREQLGSKTRCGGG